MDSVLTAEVAVPLPIDKTLTYAVPSDLAASLRVGARVVVEVKRKVVTGFVLGLGGRKRSEGRLKPIREIVDDAPTITPDLLRLARWIADYYVSPLGEVLAAMSPPAAKLKRLYSLARPLGELETEILRATSPDKAAIISLLAAGVPLDLGALKRKAGGVSVGACLEELQDEGLVSAEVVQVKRRRRPSASNGAAVPGACGAPADSAVGTTPGAREAASRPTLTREQAAALRGISRAIEDGAFRVILLLGVTGSGKTEVYLRAIEEVVRRGRRAIYLVPEIGLTPQIMARVRQRFGPRCAVLHSRLSDGERHAAWLDIMAGRVDVVVGARSAVFAPVRDLGIVIVDEEHEASYKQQDAPRYNARETAIMRAKHAGAVVILGSATPSIETYNNALAGRYDLFELSERIAGGTLPEVDVVDMRAAGTRFPLSDQAQSRIAESLGRSEQVVLFLNRRGFSNYMQCLDCGMVPKCRNCNVTLTYHLHDRRAVCHYCDYAEKGPETCPKCGGTRIEYVGSGTQKVEDSVLKAFPDAACARLDKDTTRRKGSTEALLSDFTNGIVRTLVGTQMLAKGHDFKGVGLVVVVNADVTMNLPDFRSGERTFQILTQVAGRAGRGDVPGKVVVQTFNPDHHALKFAVGHDFKGFYGEEAILREALNYPPFARLARVLFESGREYLARQVAKEFRLIALRLAKRLKGRTDIMGPSRAPVSKVKNVYRWHLLVKGPRSVGLPGLVRSCLAEARERGLDQSVRIAVDVDPQAML